MKPSGDCSTIGENGCLVAEIFLSVIVPAYNEAKRLGPSLETIRAYLQNQKYFSEILVVDDGSTDATVETAKSKLAGFPHAVLLNGTNQGKGYSVKQGMLEGKGRYLLFTDADLSTPIEECTRFLELMADGKYECVIGSRALPGSQIEVHQNMLRELMGKVFNRIARSLSFKGISDSQCGFKCFSQKAARDLFSRQKLKGFSFDAEILFLAQKLGYRVLEAPVIWRNSAQSRVKMVSDPLAMFADLVRMRWMHRDLG